jgi:hypothetical protein
VGGKELPRPPLRPDDRADQMQYALEMDVLWQVYACGGESAATLESLEMWHEGAAGGLCNGLLQLNADRHHALAWCLAHTRACTGFRRDVSVMLAVVPRGSSSPCTCLEM